MSDIGSEFELIWGATAAPFKPVAVQEPPWRQFKITRKRTPLQNEHIWRQYHTLSLGRLFKEKLLTIGDKCGGEPVVPWQPVAENLATFCSTPFGVTEAESLHLCLLNIVNKYGDLSPTVSKADALNYMRKILITSPTVEGSLSAAKDSVTSWLLGCTVKCVSDPKPSKQIPEEGRFYCCVGLLPKELKTSKTVAKHTMQKWGSIVPMQVHCTGIANGCPAWNEVLEFSVDDITKFLLVIELWYLIPDANRRRSINLSLFSGNAATGKAQEKLIGRMFLPLQKIALEGEDRALPLDPKRLNGASVLIHLSVKGSQEHVATEADLQDHRLLHRAIVMHESQNQRLIPEGATGLGGAVQNLSLMGGACAVTSVPQLKGVTSSTPGQLGRVTLGSSKQVEEVSLEHMEGASAHTSRHNLVWGEEISTMGRQLLLAHASWHGIGGLQLAAIELQVLIDCHKAKAMFAMKPFLSHLDRILQKVMGIYEGTSPSSRHEQSQELHTALLGLDAYILDMLHNHLIMVDLASPAQGTQWLTGLLMTIKKIYDVMPYVQCLPANHQDYHEVLQGSVQLAVQIWMTSLVAKVLNKNVTEQSGDKAVALRKLSEDCCEKCSKVQLYVVDIFERFGVDYYFIFIQSVDKELYKCSQELIVKDNSISIESSIIYFHAYLACRKIAKSIVSTTQSLCGTLMLQSCHLWFEPLLGHWFSAACNKCQERIEMSVNLDQFAAITDQAQISSSAVDTPVFLLQIVQFWQEVDWPVEKDTVGYQASLLCCICSSAEYYMDTLYKKMACNAAFKSTGQFVAPIKLCIVLNNMRHVNEELNSILSCFDTNCSCDQAHDLASDQSHDQACGQSHDQACDQTHDQTCDQACSNNGMEEGLLSLKESRKQKLYDKIKLFATETTKMLEPCIKRLVSGFLAALQDISIIEIVDPLCEYLAKNLMVFGEWLHSDVFQMILSSMWDSTLQALDTLMSSLHRRTTLLSPQQCYSILGETTFFHASGGGLSGDNLHTQHYKAIVRELELMCLSTRDLVLRCCADLAEQQAKAVGSPEHKLGELTLSVGYLKEKAVVEVTVLQAKLSEGRKNNHSDVLVYVWLLPQLVFTECAKKKHKTRAEKGTLEPVYNHTFLLPTDEDNLKMDGAALLLGVYSSSSKHLMGMGLVPCRDVPILGEQRLLDDTLPKRLRRDLSLVQVVVTDRMPYRELASRHTHDPEAGKFYRYLRKKLHMSI